MEGMPGSENSTATQAELQKVEFLLPGMGQGKTVCQNCQREFPIEPENLDFYKKIKVPPPTWCPECRFKRRLIFWNEHNLFKRQDSRTGKEIFSLFPNEAPLKIYDHDYWWSDAFDAREYGRGYDFSKTFFEQFKLLFDAVPWPSGSIQKMVNSDYSHNATGLKNCYLCFNGNTSEDCMYGIAFYDMKQSLDFYQCDESELCYEAFSVGSSYKTFFSMDCGFCRDSWFLRDCQNCSDCFGCTNLRHKQYYIFNQPYSKDDYLRKIKEFNLGSYASLMAMKKKVYDFWNQYPRKYMHAVHNVNSSGDYVFSSKDAQWCYQVVGVESSKWVQNVALEVKDSYDYTNWGLHAERVYETITCGENLARLKFCIECWPACQDLEYCMNCHSSNNLFGCIGIKKGQYMILNRQYSKNDYFALREKIIKQMEEVPYTDKQGRIYKYGEFFPIEFSPFAYTEAAVSDYYPLEKRGVIEQGFAWRDSSPKEFKATMQAADLPDHIKDAQEAVTKEIIACASCKKAYRIIDREFEFLKRFGIPMPRLCPNCRYLERRRFRNPYKFWHRRCMCGGKAAEGGAYQNSGLPHKTHKGGEHCPNEFETSYSPEREEIVYCEQCYQNEVA